MKKKVKVGNVVLGNGNIIIQSMTNTDTKDVQRTVDQINNLASAGAELVRISIPDKESALAVKDIVSSSPIPIIGDIHFSADPALIAIESGISKIRINPYNMSENDLKQVIHKCSQYSVPIRVGVNKGSSKRILTPKELAVSAVECSKRIEDYGLNDIVLAVKSSSVKDTVEAYRYLSELTDYPLHVGLTESGTEQSGIIKSSIAIGSLLLDGIGDTIRVSLAADPVKEVFAAKKILRAVGIDKEFVEVIACPTCARTNFDVQGVAEKVEEITKNYKKKVKIAVMGCVVNGIGESMDADFGVAGGKDKSVLFKRGEIFKTIPNSDIFSEILLYLDEEEKNNG